MPNECQDPFIERLCCVRNLREKSCCSLADYLVNDLTDHLKPENCNTIFLTESPHESEVCKRYPLAGQAGAIVAGAFVGTVGEILHCKRFDDAANPLNIFRRMGVMNVSRLPLNRKAYKNVGTLGKKGRNLLDDFQKIKEHFQKKDKQSPPSGTEDVFNAIKEDLTCRIEELKYLDADVCYVACGNVAKYFLKKACPKIQPICVPHPARPGEWFSGTKNVEVQKIVDKLLTWVDE